MTVNEAMDHRINMLKECKQRWAEKLAVLDGFDDQIQHIERIKETRDKAAALNVIQDIFRLDPGMSSRIQNNLYDVQYALQGNCATWA